MTNARRKKRGPVIEHCLIDPATQTPIAIHCRQYYETGPKSVWWKQPDGTLGLNGQAPNTLPLYGAHQLPASPPPGTIVVLPEGEMAQAVLDRLHIAAVGTVTGAPDAPTRETLVRSRLAGTTVVLWPDASALGLEMMRRTAQQLDGVAVDIRWTQWTDWPGAPELEDDAVDCLRRYGPDAVRTIITKAIPEMPALPAGLDTPEAASGAWHEYAGPTETEIPGRPWPEAPDPAAYHGPAGEFVRLIADQTEADPIGILVQTLLLVGTLAGRGPHIQVESDRHHLNEFAVLVGPSAKGRKGTGAGHIKRLAAGLDFLWRQDGFVGGLSSGEGLIDAVHDPIEELKTIRERGQPPRQELVTVDLGVSDKRLLVFEPEFSRVLRVMLRRENTLSAILRQAWDGDATLRVMTRTSKLRATDAHISLVGHIGGDELLRYLDSTEAGNGFGNRFGFFCVRRTHTLPFGGRVPAAAFAAMVTKFQEILEFARGTTAAFTWSPEAAEQWEAIYPTLSQGRPGLLGSVTARAEAHTLRYTCLYSLLDRSITIHPQHLRAALALWEAAEASAAYVFGDALGDRTADAILKVLRRTPLGLTRTEISALFGRHLPASELERALSVLLGAGRVRRRSKTTGGRPVERWEAVR
jgi:hypothetical protein